MKIVIGQGSCGVATGAKKTAAEFEKQLAEKNLDLTATLDAEEAYKEVVDTAGTDVFVWSVAPEREGIEEFVKYAGRVNPHAVFAVGHSEATPAQVRKMNEQQHLVIFALAKMAEGRDKTSENHAENVGKNARMLAMSLQFSPKFPKEITNEFVDMIEERANGNVNRNKI